MNDAVTQNIVDNKTPAAIGIGVMIQALFAGLAGSFNKLPYFLLCPLLCFVWAPLIVLLPPVAVLLMLRLYRRTSIAPLWRGRALPAVLITCLYWLCAVLVIRGCAQAITSTAFSYARYGDSDDLTVTHHFAYILQTGTGLMFLLLALVLLLLTRLLTADKSAASVPSLLKFTLKALLINLPGFMFVCLLLIVALTVIERSFAHFAVQYLQTAFSGEDPGTNWSLAYLLLRLYAVHVAAMAVLVASFGICRVWPAGFKKRDDGPGPANIRP